jgi:hypothetical protein
MRLVGWVYTPTIFSRSAKRWAFTPTLLLAGAREVITICVILGQVFVNLFFKQASIHENK